MFIIVNKNTNECYTKWGHFKLSRDYARKYSLLKNAIKMHNKFQNNDTLVIKKIEGENEITVYPNEKQMTIFDLPNLNITK